MNNNDTMKRTFASSIDKNNLGQNLTFIGWIEDFRDMGKIGFISVRDMTGNFQGVVTGELLSNLREIPKAKCYHDKWNYPRNQSRELSS